jgi:hypothetical protein
MINYDTLFDDENKDLLAKLEAESAGILGRLDGSSGEGNNALDKIRANKEYRSPFMDANNIPIGANLLTDIPTSTFAFTGLDQYGNAGYQYLVATIPCDDGAKVFSTYERTSVQKHELYLFYENEKPDKNNLFGTFYIAKMGDSFSGIIKNFLDTNYKIPATINQKKVIDIQDYNSLTNYVNSVAQNQHSNTLDFDTTYNAIAREYNSKTDIGQLIEGLSSIDEIIAEGINWCADKLDGLLISESSYIPSENYKPVIGQTKNEIGAENLVVNLFEDAANSEFVKDAEAVIEEAYMYIKDAFTKLGKALLEQLPEPIKKVIRKLQKIVIELKTGIQNIIADVTAFLKNIGNFIGEVLKLINAFLCGIINGIIGTVQAILRVVAFLVDMNGMDADYKSYLKRRDVGEKIESVFDFISESFSSVMGALKNLFTQSGETTVEDIKRFIKSIGSFFEKAADGVEDFFENTSRFKFAYWAGIVFFEVAINILLLVFTGGLGTVAKATTYLEKIGAFSKIVGREMISVATFGVVDILALFKSLIGAFVRACSKGLKGFLRWIEELIKGIKSGKAKNGEELLEDVERAVGMAENLKTTINVEEFLASAKRLENIRPEEALKYLDEALVHFNHEVVDGVVVQISNKNCAVVVQRVDEYIRTGKITKAVASKTTDIKILQDKYSRTFLSIEGLPSLNKLFKDGDRGIVAGLKYDEEGHVFNVIRENGVLKFIDGQSDRPVNLYIKYDVLKYFKTPK